MEHFVCIAFKLATKMGHSLFAKLCYSEQNMLFLDCQIKRRILELSQGGAASVCKIVGI